MTMIFRRISNDEIKNHRSRVRQSRLFGFLLLYTEFIPFCLVFCIVYLLTVDVCKIDEGRAELPLTADKQDTFFIGLTLETGCTHQLTIGMICHFSKFYFIFSPKKWPQPK